MSRAAQGRPGRQAGPLKEKTLHALGTKSRIHGIVAQVIDELEKRRTKGKGDHIASLADEVEKGGIAAWKSLKELLPADDVQPAAAPMQFNLASVFVAAAKQASERHAAAGAPAILEGTALPIIDVLADEPAPGYVGTEPPPDDNRVDW
jgi:hypothetical protein